MKHLGPHPALLEAYGSDFYRQSLEKRAGMPLSLMLAGPLLSAGLLAGDAHHAQQMVAEAELVNEQLQELEGSRMAGAVAGLQGQGRALSYQGESVRNIMPMRSYWGALGLQDPGMVRTASAAAGALAKMAQAGTNKEAMGLGMAQGIMQGVKGLVQGGGATARLLSAAGGAAPAAPGLTQRAVGAVKGLGAALKPGWKTKALGAAGLAGVGVAGYKGLQTARDYMMQPTYASTAWGGPGLGAAGAVNEYGYVTPRF